MERRVPDSKVPRDAKASGERSIDELIDHFASASHEDDNGVEFWFARDVQQLLGYLRWDTFLDVVEKAKQACKGSGHPVENHFSDVRKMVPIGSGAEREIHDVALTRYACYLIAQNGDPRKQPIAFAQTYFAIQTRRQEIQDDEQKQSQPLSEEHKRLLLRNEITEHNKKLANAAKNAGIEKPMDYAIFQNFGYRGLYGGLDNVGIKRRKSLKSSQNILDHMGSTELAANLFRATQTDEKLRKDGAQDKATANRTHLDVGKKVRRAISDIGGTMPEDLPVAEDIKKVAKRIEKVSLSNKPDK